MLSKQQQKNILALHTKKNRQESGLFLVEGAKNLVELMQSDFEVEHLFCTTKWIEKYEKLATKVSHSIDEPELIEKVSTFKANDSGVAIVRQKKNQVLSPEIKKPLILVLDGIKDPGNLGTIIRLADWYGIPNIVCSDDTVEFYNPKVISATMGSFTRVQVGYTSLEDWLNNYESTIYGAYLTGENIHKIQAIKPAALVIGSESHGIRKEIEPYISSKITIPCFGGAESLNAGVATGILLDNLVRN
ncbi:MAG: TrmH family RNA methyltransferase [Spirosomataceae bacterium]